MADTSLAPCLLVAMPQLLDPNFHRSVVLLIHHDEEGTFGVVVNRETDFDAPSLCATLEIDWGGHPHEGVDWGGPVQPQTGWILFDESADVADEDVKHVADGICFAGSLDVLRQIAGAPPSNLRLLLGYAGWGPGQLESELAQGAWITAPATAEAVFRVALPDMWEHVLRELGIEPATLIPTTGVH